MPEEVLVGRQPIYNERLDVVAFELLFRGAASQTTASFTDGDKATSQVILNTFLEIGLDNIVGQLPAFINLTRAFLVGHQQLPMQKDRVVLEVLENIEVDEEILSALRSLAERGYTIALDDFVYEHRYSELVDIAHIVKIDVLALGRETLREHVRLLQKHDVRLLAEKVETQEDFEYCRSLGFDYYQGFFFSKPKTISGQRLPTNRLAVLQVLAMLQDPESDVAKLDREITKDVSLSYKLLRYVNSSYFALPTKIDSIHRALILLGVDNIRNWVSLIALSGINDKPNYLILDAMVRAKMFELLAEAAKRPDRERYFTVGLFSLLDALLDLPMDDILRSLPLSEEIGQALLGQQGDLGKALRCVLNYEHSDWEALTYAALDIHTIKETYLRAIAWAREAIMGLADINPAG